MGMIFICLVTLMAIGVIIGKNFCDNRKIIKNIKKLFDETNEIYKELFNERFALLRVIQGIMIIGAEIFMGISVSVIIIKSISLRLDLLIKALIILVVLIVIHYFIAYILLISCKMHKITYKVKDKNLKVDLILIYFIISSYFLVLTLSSSEFYKSYIVGFIGTFICYILNLKVLINVIKNPKTLHYNEDGGGCNNIIVASILIVLLIVLNLFLATCFVYSASPGAFSNVESNFDLFYYTIVTFTAVGYGDIVPITPAAKVISMLISITSVICITIFLSTVLSYKKK